MKPSKKKPKNRMTKPPQIESAPPTDPNLHQSSTLTSTSQSRSSDLAWLSDAFSSLSADQIESAYDEAGCDTFKTAGILGTPLEVEQEEEYGCNTGPTASENSSQKKAKKVSSVIGKDYPGSHSESNDKIQRDVEEAEEFLCSMLGENSDLGMGVVRDILGMCRGDVRKALELLLELSGEAYCPQTRERVITATNNSNVIPKQAAFEYSRGNRSHASCLAEKGNYYRDLAHAEDERASLEIFRARNEAYKNTTTIDLHGQHVKEGIGILKQHLLSFTRIPSVKYLTVITGWGGFGDNKGKLKRSVKSLATREKIEWSEENLGTIVLKIKGQKNYRFTDSDGGEE